MGVSRGVITESGVAMEAMKAAVLAGDLSEVDSLYTEACTDIGNRVEDKAGLCLYCVYAHLNFKDYSGGERYLLEALGYSNDPRCRSIRGRVLFNLFRLKFNQGDDMAATNYGQMAIIELENGLPDTQNDIDYIRARMG